MAEAAAAAERHPEAAERPGVATEEMAAWRDAAEAIHVPFDQALGVHPQDADFLTHERWDFDATPEDHYPLLLHYPYFELYRKQVVKQADLVLALYLCGDRFTDQEKPRAFDHYEGLTVRDSALSACVQAIAAAEVGHLELAYDYLTEAAFMDIRTSSPARRTESTWPPWAAPCLPHSPASADCASVATASPSAPAP